MPYILRECTEDKQNNMDKIWDGVWSELDVGKQLKKIQTDKQLPIFLKYLSKDGKILEAGCGLGQWVIYLRNLGYDIMGIDFAEETIKTIKKHDDTIPVELGDVVGTNFEDNHFDAYISLGVVEHFVDGPLVALKEAKRILKKNGLLLISIPVFNPARRATAYLENCYNFLKENKYVRKMFGKDEYPEKEFIEYRYTMSEFENILKKEKFFIIDKYPIMHSPFGMFNYFLEPPKFLKKGEYLHEVVDAFAKFLKRKSPWIAPHLVMWICKNGKRE